MKRIGNLYDQICSLDNLERADTIAQKGKSKQPGVIKHNLNQSDNICQLRNSLLNKTYTTSKYTIFKVFEPKERDIYRLPYYPDHIIDHAIMNISEPVFLSVYTADTYSGIKGRGIHTAVWKLKRTLRQDEQGTRYCLKLDIHKFYPSIDHAILKKLLRKKFKDENLLWLFDEIVDSTDGLAIGSYLSIFLANYYLAFFDHWLKETKQVKYYFRYADDMVILAGNKPYLHQLLHAIKDYLNDNLNLTLKDNYQVFPIEARGIDFLGYLFRHEYILLRKNIKKNFARMTAHHYNKESVASYKGWAKHCNSKHLLKKLL